ncbi:hypothetical protein ABZ467_39680, partial [Streptomyces sp. NPDC005727]|uniref:hypothetical protein n=1 Tax=Streptomyces sp. NPDC005727 TaxID=3157053 RepID=UPI0033C1D74D
RGRNGLNADQNRKPPRPDTPSDAHKSNNVTTPSADMIAQHAKHQTTCHTVNSTCRAALENAYQEPLAGHTQTAVRLTEPLSAEVGIGRGTSVVTWVGIGIPPARLDTPIHTQLPMIQSEGEKLAVLLILETEHHIGGQARVFVDRMPFPAD